MNVTFGQNDQMKMFFIVVQDDDIVEETENHYIHLRVPTGETRVTLLQENVTVTVSDDDSKCVYACVIMQGFIYRGDS